MTAQSISETEFAVLQRQIDALATRLEQGFERMEKLLQAVEERMREMEKREAACQPLLSSRIDAAWRKLDEHDTAIITLEKTMQEAVFTNRILKWLLTVLTAVLTALLIAIIMGKV